MENELAIHLSLYIPISKDLKDKDPTELAYEHLEELLTKNGYDYMLYLAEIR